MKIESSVVSTNTLSQRSEISHSEKMSSEKADMVKQALGKEDQAAFPGERKLIDAIEKANPELAGHNTSIRFSVHEKTKQIMIKIMDNSTDEIIKEIPSEKILDMVADMMEKAGLFVDKRG